MASEYSVVLQPAKHKNNNNVCMCLKQLTDPRGSSIWRLTQLVNLKKTSQYFISTQRHRRRHRRHRAHLRYSENT